MKGAQFTTKPGSELSKGDTVQVWWGRKVATVSGFTDHDSGREGWFIANFADGFSMTVTPLDRLMVARASK